MKAILGSHVSYNITLSSSQPVFYGVPQGLILDPLLFLLYFNETEKQLENCEIMMYATVINFHHNNIFSIEHALTKDLKNLSDWLEENELILNLKQEKNRDKINNTERYQYLGVNLDPPLTMVDHFNSVCRRVSGRLRMLRKIRSHLSATAALRIYQAMIVPNATYCSLTNYFHQPYRMHMLELLDST
ncbi:uncharacterized protein LOC130628654 [Hydractinia symbiolongicarpus]|uniref:uncharacterized protein LOC130628654 n=1 Tax=Hydractinia symbiolongicarpus TaxID=13093 RepID=UPI00254C1592|nr:uncharacterized protein LOC130628654 [Hydractinia symbiolongicarpus]